MSSWSIDHDASGQSVIALGHELGVRPLVAHCSLGLGKLSRVTGNGEEAGEIKLRRADGWRKIAAVLSQHRAVAA